MFIVRNHEPPLMTGNSRLPALLILFAAGTLLAGCIGGQQAAQVTPTPASGPDLFITSPEDGAVLPAGDITVSVRVVNFRLVPKFGQKYVAGEGHLHYYMGVGTPATGSASSVAPVSYAATTDTSYTWPDVPPGTYTFTVELANNDHSPFPAPIAKSVTVKVVGPLTATPPATTGAGGGP